MAVVDSKYREWIAEFKKSNPNVADARAILDTAKYAFAAGRAAQRAHDAILRTAPEAGNDVIERAAKALHANGADSMTSDTPWSELHDGEVNQFRSWARAALVAARPQGVKDAT